MKNVLSRTLTTLRHPRGASAVEYMVALMLVGLVILALIRLFGDTVRQKYEGGEQRISGMDKETEQGSGVVATSEEGDEAGNGGNRGRKGRFVASNKGAGSDSSGSNGSLGGAGDDAEEEARLAEARKKGYAVKTEKSEQEKAFGSGSSDTIRRDRNSRHYHLPGEEPDIEAGLNPFIIFVILLVGGGLLFFIFKSQTAGNKS